jgi:hypothetical protein
MASMTSLTQMSFLLMEGFASEMGLRQNPVGQFISWLFELVEGSILGVWLMQSCFPAVCAAGSSFNCRQQTLTPIGDLQ